MELCDWDYEGDDDRVLAPVIESLKEKDDDMIFKFHDLMSELLYKLDTKKLVYQCEKAEPYMSDDSFLYSRCVALINGPEYYIEAKSGKKEEIWDMEFESLLYVPQKAWALKHGKDVNEYPHFPPFDNDTIHSI